MSPPLEIIRHDRIVPFLDRGIDHTYEGKLLLGDEVAHVFRRLHRYHGQEISAQWEYPIIQNREGGSAPCGYVRIETGNTNEGSYESLKLRTNRSLRLQKRGNLPPIDVLFSMEVPEYEDPLQVREDCVRSWGFWHAHDLSSVLPTKLFLQKHITSLDKVRGSEE